MNPEAIKSLLGVSEDSSPEPTAEAPPVPVPEVKVTATPVPEETMLQRQTRQAQERQAAKAVLAQTPKEPSLEVDMAQLRVEVRQAEEALQAVQAEADEKNKAVKAAQKVVEQKRFEMRNRDKRTAAEINREYIDRQIKLRFEQHAAVVAKQTAAMRTGIFTEQELQALNPSASPLDRAVSDRNHKSRLQN